MDRRRLGKSAITVSSVCLGTMTFGNKTDETEACAIMDHAYESGIDFFDAAELYPVPPKKEYVGRTEEIVGKWLKDKPRESLIIATKVVGPGHGWFKPPVRNGRTALDQMHIFKAVEGSLKRLKTDYIDLYQTHWPDHEMDQEITLRALDKLIQQGKVRAVGCSNETCWGVMKNLEVSKAKGLARLETVQNNFSLINRRCESELAQVCRREEVSLLPYSPLGGGVLTGKYNQSYPKDGRFTSYLEGAKRQRKMAEKFVNPRSLEATARFIEMAKELEVHPAAFALAWSKQHDFVASTIVGATTLAQLKESLPGADLELDKATIRAINKVDEDIPNPLKEDNLRRL